MKFSKWVVLLCIAMTTGYTVFNLWLCMEIGEQPSDVLTASIFAMYSIEFGSMAFIKHGESKYEMPVEGEHVKEEE